MMYPVSYFLWTLSILQYLLLCVVDNVGKVAQSFPYAMESLASWVNLL